jgi:hypothetical protein
MLKGVLISLFRNPYNKLCFVIYYTRRSGPCKREKHMKQGRRLNAFVLFIYVNVIVHLHYIFCNLPFLLSTVQFNELTRGYTYPVY